MTTRSRDWLVVLCVVFFEKLLVLPSCADFPLEELYWRPLLLFVGSLPPTPLCPSPPDSPPPRLGQMVQSSAPSTPPVPHLPPPLIEGMNESEAFQHIPAADWWPSSTTSQMKTTELKTMMMMKMMMMKMLLLLLGTLVLDGAAAQQQQGE